MLEKIIANLAEGIKRVFAKGDCMHAILLPEERIYICIANKRDCEYFAGKKPEYFMKNDNGAFGRSKYLICPHYAADKKG